MTMQLTFRRGHYTGHWVEDNVEYIKEVTGFYPPGGSGSLQIFFNDKEVTDLHDVTEKTAETVCTDYVRPDTQEIAQGIVDHLTSHRGIDYLNALQSAIADYGLRPDDIDSVKRHLKTLLQADGFDTSELDEVGVEGC